MQRNAKDRNLLTLCDIGLRDNPLWVATENMGDDVLPSLDRGTHENMTSDYLDPHRPFLSVTLR